MFSRSNPVSANSQQSVEQSIPRLDPAVEGQRGRIEDLSSRIREISKGGRGSSALRELSEYLQGDSAKLAATLDQEKRGIRARSSSGPSVTHLVSLLEHYCAAKYIPSDQLSLEITSVSDSRQLVDGASHLIVALKSAAAPPVVDQGQSSLLLTSTLASLSVVGAVHAGYSKVTGWFESLLKRHSQDNAVRPEPLVEVKGDITLSAAPQTIGVLRRQLALLLGKLKTFETKVLGVSLVSQTMDPFSGESTWSTGNALPLDPVPSLPDISRSVLPINGSWDVRYRVTAFDTNPVTIHFPYTFAKPYEIAPLTVITGYAVRSLGTKESPQSRVLKASLFADACGSPTVVTESVPIGTIVEMELQSKLIPANTSGRDLAPVQRAIIERQRGVHGTEILQSARAILAALSIEVRSEFTELSKKFKGLPPSDAAAQLREWLHSRLHYPANNSDTDKARRTRGNFMQRVFLSGVANCYDSAVVGAALMHAAGFEVRFISGSPLSMRLMRFASHVEGVGRLPGGYYAGVRRSNILERAERHAWCAVREPAAGGWATVDFTPPKSSADVFKKRNRLAHFNRQEFRNAQSELSSAVRDCCGGPDFLRSLNRLPVLAIAEDRSLKKKQFGFFGNVEKPYETWAFQREQPLTPGKAKLLELKMALFPRHMRPEQLQNLAAGYLHQARAMREVSETSISLSKSFIKLRDQLVPFVHRLKPQQAIELAGTLAEQNFALKSDWVVGVGGPREKGLLVKRTANGYRKVTDITYRPSDFAIASAAARCMIASLIGNTAEAGKNLSEAARDVQNLCLQTLCPSLADRANQSSWLADGPNVKSLIKHALELRNTFR